jgi:hypothetical protein
MREQLSKQDAEQKKVILEAVFVFCMVWSIGAVIDAASRAAFDDLLRYCCLPKFRLTAFGADSRCATGPILSLLVAR